MALPLHIFFAKNATLRHAMIQAWKYLLCVRLSSFFRLDGLAEFYLCKLMGVSQIILDACAGKAETTTLLEIVWHRIDSKWDPQAEISSVECLADAHSLWDAAKILACLDSGSCSFLSKARMVLVVGGLSALLGLAGLYAYWDRIGLVRQAKIARANIQLDELSKRFSMVKDKYKLPLSAVTERGCSYCPCKTGKNASTFPTDDVCVKQWRDSVTKILALSGMDIAQIKKYYEDPWGAPFGLDELDAPGSCNADIIVCAGPDGIFGAEGNIKRTLEKKFCKN